MIIEAFGPPGAGKTTFSRALAQRLRQRGYTVDLILFPRLKSEFLSSRRISPSAATRHIRHFCCHRDLVPAHLKCSRIASRS